MDDGPEPFLTPGHYDAIGRLVVAASYLDGAMTQLIRIVSNMSFIDSLILVHHQQFASKVDTIKALMHTHFGDNDDLKFLTDAINDAKRLYDYRSTLVHAIWTEDEHGGEAPLSIRYTARGKLIQSRIPRPVSEIQAYASEAMSLAARLSQLVMHLVESQNAPSEPDPKYPQ